jgi:hypothetical protein
MLESKSFNTPKQTNEELFKSIESRVDKAKISHELQNNMYGITDLDFARSDIVNKLNEGIAKVTNITSKRIKNPLGDGEIDIVIKGTLTMHKCFENLDIKKIREMNIDNLLSALKDRLVYNNTDSCVVGEFGKDDIAFLCYMICSDYIPCDVDGKYCKPYLKAEMKNDKPVGTMFLALEDIAVVNKFAECI